MTETLGFSSRQLVERGAEHTAREITQQPAIWRETSAFVLSHRNALDAFLGPLLKRPDLRIVLTGAGTSAFAGEILAPALARRLGRRVDAIATTDMVSNPDEYFAGNQPTLLVSFARSGNSPESVTATVLAEQCLTECYHLVLTCDAAGRLYKEHHADEHSFTLLMPEAANDQGFAMTSSFTSMVLAAWLALGKVAPGNTVERLAAAGERLLGDPQVDLRGLASAGYERVVYLGSGPLKGLARESSLKLLELTAGAIVTLSDSPMGFRHGPKAILADRTLVVVYISSDPYTQQYDLDLVEELRSQTRRSGNVVAVTASQEAVSDGSGTWLLEDLESEEDAVLALPFVMIAQLLGLYFSLALDRTPDNPFPDKEVNRVVQGVTIHPLRNRR